MPKLSPALLAGMAAIALALAGCGTAAVDHATATAPQVTVSATPVSAPSALPGAAPLATLPLPRRDAVRIVSFWSRSLHSRQDFAIYMPPGYARAARAGVRFPVLYLLHPPSGLSGLGYFSGGRLAGIADKLIRTHGMRPMLVVLPMGHTALFRDDTEWANARAGRYESFVIDTVHAVDHRFATIADRQHRGLGGLSMGGYGALNVALHHLRTFAVAESWSGYFKQTPTGPFVGLGSIALAKNSPVSYVPSLSSRIRRLGLRAFVYQGMRDDMHPGEIRAFSAELARAGADVRWGFFPGGHGWGLWRHELPRMLQAASHWFAQSPALARRGELLRLGGQPVPWACYHHYSPGITSWAAPAWCARYAHIGMLRGHAAALVWFARSRVCPASPTALPSSIGLPASRRSPCCGRRMTPESSPSCALLAPRASLPPPPDANRRGSARCAPPSSPTASPAAPAMRTSSRRAARRSRIPTPSSRSATCSPASLRAAARLSSLAPRTTPG